MFSRNQMFFDSLYISKALRIKMRTSIKNLIGIKPANKIPALYNSKQNSCVIANFSEGSPKVLRRK